MQPTTGYRIELHSQSADDEFLRELASRDALGRRWRATVPELPFDRRWSEGLLLYAGGSAAGYVHVEAARIFPVQPLKEAEWEEYQFGALLQFPFAGDSDDYEGDCGRLLDAAVDLLQQRYPPSKIYCLIPVSAKRQATILRAHGFEAQARTCLETEILNEHGYGRDDEIEIYERPPDANDGPDPLRQLTARETDLRIFSNAQTKIRLVPTLEFWGTIQLYTTYSAYPFIPQFLRQLRSELDMRPLRRVLVAPCAGGDFLRLWPLDIGVPEESSAVDIRDDLVRLARLRIRVPEIDILNLSLCELLYQVVIRDGAIDDAVREEVAGVYRRLGLTRSEPGFLRFDDPASLPLLARAFDEILRNRAIPDWYFPLKILASAHPETVDPARTDILIDWLDQRTEEIRSVVASLGALGRDANGAGIREKYARTCLAEAKVHVADLLRTRSVPAGPFDLILCWEFIHVFHDPVALGGFIDSMRERLAPGGHLIITNIREPSETVPDEQEWARQHLRAKGIPFEARFIGISGTGATGSVPFERRLHAHYPVLIVEARDRQ